MLPSGASRERDGAGSNDTAELHLECCLCRSDLLQPLLLSCFHSCCARCTDGATCRSEDGQDRVVCRKCGSATSLHMIRENTFIGAKVRKASATPLLCDVCKTEPADQRCIQCDQSLCSQCTQWHDKFLRKHVVRALADDGNDDKQGMLTDQPKCAAHQRGCTVYCPTCDSLKCSICREACAQVQHAASAVDSKQASDRATAIGQCLQETAKALEVEQPRLMAYDNNISDELNALAVADMHRLDLNRETVLNAVSRAYSEARAALSQAHARLLSRAASSRQASLLLAEQLGHLCTYSRSLAASGTVGDILDQHVELAARMRALLLEARAIPVTTNMRACVLVRTVHDQEVQRVAQRWTGFHCETSSVDSKDLSRDCIADEMFEIPGLVLLANNGALEISDWSAPLISESECDWNTCRLLSGSLSQHAKPTVDEMAEPIADGPAEPTADGQGRTELMAGCNPSVNEASARLLTSPNEETLLLISGNEEKPLLFTSANKEKSLPLALANEEKPLLPTSANEEKPLLPTSAYEEKPLLLTSTNEEKPLLPTSANEEKLLPLASANEDSLPMLGAAASEKNPSFLTTANEDKLEQHRASSEGKSLIAYCCMCNQQLSQPMLLSCLHSCCAECVKAMQQQQQQHQDCVLCPRCDHITALADVVPNCFLAGRAHAVDSLAGPPMCDSCQEFDAKAVEAVHGCRDCNKRLCEVCLRWHKKFSSHTNVVPLAERGLALPPSGQPLPLCEQHNAKCSTFCFDCDKLCCVVCCQPCRVAKHDVGALDDHATDCRAQEAVNSFRAALHSLSLSDKDASSLLGDLPQRLGAARLADMQGLRIARETAMQYVSRASDEAESAVAAIYDGYAARVPELQRVARLLEGRLQQASEYCELLLSSANAACVLDQRRAIMSCLKGLEAMHRAMPAVLGQTSFTVVDRHRSDDLYTFVKSCIGFPKRSAEELLSWPALCEPRKNSTSSAVQSQAAPPQTALLPGSGSADRLQKDGPESGSGHESSRAMGNFIQNDIVITAEAVQPPETAFSEFCAFSKFRVDDDSVELVFAADGRAIFVAAKESGMLEYDSRKGTKLSSWRPPPAADEVNDCVSCLQALQDDTVVVGLIYSQSIALLRRFDQQYPGKSWYEVQRIMLRTGPWHMSCHGELLAVAGACQTIEDGSLSWSPGPYLDLMHLPSCDYKLMETQDFNVQSVALTAHTLAVLSAFAEPSGRCAIVAYDHHGVLMWRSSLAACNICAALGRSLIFAANAQGGCLQVLKEDDGEDLGNIPRNDGSCSVIAPRCVAPFADGQHMTLAVLSVDNVVTTYPDVNLGLSGRGAASSP